MSEADSTRRPSASAPSESGLNRERWRLLRRVAKLLDTPMTVLAFVWLVLLIVDFVEGLSPWQNALTQTIWVLFVLHFLLEFLIAPGKLPYLRRHWLTMIALALPALRVFRAVRALRLLRLSRAARPLGLLRLVTSLNRSMRSIQRFLGQYGAGYVIVLTVLVVFAGAAGMYRFERPGALREAGYAELADRGVGLTSYGDAVWWTAMIVTTMGSEYWPKTVEGRFLGWLLALYAFGTFSYITATVASFFVGQSSPSAQSASDPDEEVEVLREEIAALRDEIALLTARLPRPAEDEPPPGGS